MRPENGKYFHDASGIRAVIFDYGDVLCMRAPLSEFAPMAKILNLTPEGLVERYMQNRLAYDRGDLTLAEYWNGFARETGVTLSNSQLEELGRRDCALWWRLDPELMEWIGRLRTNGIKAGVLSNMFLGLAELIRQGAPRFNKLLDKFDAFTASAEIRETKPHEDSYRHILRQLGVEPRQALFLDDRQTNIDGAHAIGMEALLYTTPAELRRDLEEWNFPVLPGAMFSAETVLKTS